MFPRVVETRALNDWRLWVRFDDGAAGEVDLSEVAGKGVFAAWNDPSVWKAVRLAYNGRSVEWPGDIDICPDLLYHEVTGAPLPGSRVRPDSDAA